MKVKLLKDHIDHKKGDEIEVTPERANYFKLIGLVKGEGVPYSEAKKTDKTPLDETVIALEEVSKIDVNEDGVIGDPEKKKKKPSKEKNDKAGPNAKKK